MEFSPTAPGSTNGAGAPPPGALIKDSDTRSFMADVVETSRKVPVIVDGFVATAAAAIAHAVAAHGHGRLDVDVGGLGGGRTRRRAHGARWTAL